MATTPSGNRLRTHIKDLTLLFGIPIGIIIIIAALLYVPRLFANPGYDFIYCTGYSCSEQYTVNPSGKIVEMPNENRYTFESSTLYYYDVERNTSRPLWSSVEALQYKLDPTLKSPDGYTLEHTTSGGDFLFSSNYRNNWSLTKGLVARPVTLDASGRNNHFIGWVLP